MGAKVIRCGDAADEALLRGVDLVADLVGTTLGPAGRAVLVERPHAAPLMLGDGYAILQQLDLADPGEQLGLQAMRELAWRTSDAVGDGTSTALVLARGFLRAGRRALATGLGAAELQDALDRHAARVVAALEGLAVPAEARDRLVQVGAQAADGDRALGELVADAHLGVGVAGVVQVEEGRGREDLLEVATGLHFDQGWISPYFVEDQKAQSVTIDDPLIILHLEPLDELGPVLPVLEMIAKAGRGLVILAESIGGDALSTLVVNRQRAGFKVAAVKAPGTGPWRQLMLEDIAIATGGTVIARQLGTTLANLRPAMAGQARQVTITRTGTTIAGGRGAPDAIAARARSIRLAIEREKHLSFDREQHQKRLARLEAGIATLRVGGTTASEIAVRQRRARSASAAIGAARAGGVLPGGCAAFCHAGRLAGVALGSGLVDRMVGQIFGEALAAPLRRLVDNAGLDGRAVVWRLSTAEGAGQCFDVQAGAFRPGDALHDPLPVLRTALLNASSTAARLLSVAVAITSEAA